MAYYKKGNDLYIKRGDSATIDLTFTDDDGNAINITGSTIYFTAKSDLSLDDSEAELQVEVTSHTDASNGLSNIPISGNDTDITAGKYYFDIQLNIGTAVHTIWPVKDQAYLYIQQDVTES